MIDVWQNPEPMPPEELRSARRTLHWTQEQMGFALGLTQDHVRRWASGIYKVHPCAAKLIRLYLAHPEVRPRFVPKRQLRNC